MNNLCIAISNYKSHIKVLYIEYIDDRNNGKQTKIWYIKNHKANDSTVIFAGWLSLEEIRDNLYEFLDIDTIEILESRDRMREDNFEEDNFGEELYEEYLYFEYKDKYESVKEQLVEKEKEIEILNNNWNELENYIKVELKNVIPMWTLETHYSFGESTIYDYILNKMKELKGNNKE